MSKGSTASTACEVRRTSERETVHRAFTVGLSIIYNIKLTVGVQVGAGRIIRWCLSFDSTPGCQRSDASESVGQSAVSLGRGTAPAAEPPAVPATRWGRRGNGLYLLMALLRSGTTGGSFVSVTKSNASCVRFLRLRKYSLSIVRLCSVS